MIAIKCRECGNNFKTFPSRVNRKYCSRKCSIEASKGISINANELNVNWKGDDAGLGAIHLWARARKPKPDLCEKCNLNPPYDLANISGQYKRDINDFRWLCRSCHKKEHDIKDGRIIIKKCPICKLEFRRKQCLNQKYCSYRCEGESRKNKIERRCEFCGSLFCIIPYYIKKGWGKFCSNKCYHKSKRNRIERMCKFCGKTIYVVPAKVKIGEGKFCSMKCVWRYQSGRKVKER